MKKLFVSILLILAGLILSFHLAEAAFSISARPLEGGFELRFGSISASQQTISKELIINITSDIGSQYQVVQTLLDPLTNTEGVTIKPHQLTVFTLRGSNLFGSLRLSDPTEVSLTRNILYTSDSNGSSDSFRLVYSLSGPFSPGFYKGRFAFTLEPIQSQVMPITIILPISVEVKQNQNIQIEFFPESSLLRLTPQPDGSLSGFCELRITNTYSYPLTISQMLSCACQNQYSDILPENTIQCFLQKDKDANKTLLRPLSLKPEIIYTSRISEKTDYLTIVYSLLNPDRFKTGKYHCRLSLFVNDYNNIQKILKEYDLEFNIPKVFNLIAEPTKSGIIEFDVKPNVFQIQTNEVKLTIISNSGKSYQVSQKLSSELVNKDGVTIPKKNFRMRLVSNDTKGNLKFIDPIPVETQETVLFVSDKKGSPDSFTIIYELIPSLEIPAGEYTTSITYIISEC
ncbi:MAG: hypothetical protein N2606_07475 [Candidatus Omnitrophica bacterium]|nr:hypothetical protein [Candidatus Omnitrophota bacterium]